MFAVHCQALGKAVPSPCLLSASNRKSTKESRHLQDDRAPGLRAQVPAMGLPESPEQGNVCVIKGAVLCRAGSPGPARQGRW